MFMLIRCHDVGVNRTLLLLLFIIAGVRTDPNNWSISIASPTICTKSQLLC